MSIKVISPLFFRYNEQQTLTATGKTIGECLNDLVRQFPDLKDLIFTGKGGIHDFLYVYLNKEAAPADGVLNLPVKSGDEVHIVVLIEGG